jgi:hypothetical protein
VWCPWVGKQLAKPQKPGQKVRALTVAMLVRFMCYAFPATIAQ